MAASAAHTMRARLARKFRGVDRDYERMCRRIAEDVPRGTLWIERSWLDSFGRDEVQRLVFAAGGGPILPAYAAPPKIGHTVEALGRTYELVGREGRWSSPTQVWERKRG